VWYYFTQQVSIFIRLSGQNVMMQLEKKLKEFGSVPVGHGTLLSILGDYRSPNDKIAQMIGDGGDSYLPSIVS
jgi:hypothetical protein